MKRAWMLLLLLVLGTGCAGTKTAEGETQKEVYTYRPLRGNTLLRPDFTELSQQAEREIEVIPMSVKKDEESGVETIDMRRGEYPALERRILAFNKERADMAELLYGNNDYQYHVTIRRNDTAVVSFLLTYDNLGYQGVKSWNFDPLSGRRILLHSVIRDTGLLSKLAAKKIRDACPDEAMLHGHDPERSLYNLMELSLAEGGLDFNFAWCLTEEGIELYYTSQRMEDGYTVTDLYSAEILFSEAPALFHSALIP